MTTLFNLFCPLILYFYSISYSIFLMVVFGMVMVYLIMESFFILYLATDLKVLFPSEQVSMALYFSLFVLICNLNLLSMVVYTYPVTTTLMFNFHLSMAVWLGSLLLLINKAFMLKAFLPSNTPSYLVPFLSVVEMTSNLVRPVTLAFRLMANMCAGHILLTLMLKLGYGLWIVGLSFSLLELMVCFVQAYVFVMLISVYYGEAK